MSCPHGRYSSPETCSLCLGVKAQQVGQTGKLITVDGKAVRPIELGPWSPGIKRSATGRQRWGGRRK